MAALVISAGTLFELKRMAEIKGVTAEALAEQALRHFLREEKRQMMRQEAKAFQKMHLDLWANYPGEYVALYQGQLVDHDPDQLALFTRIDK